MTSQYSEHEPPVPPAAPPGGQGPLNGGGRRRHRRRVVLVGTVGGVIALVLVAVGVASLAGAFDSGPDAEDPAAVATAFVQRYATHDPSVCELVNAKLDRQFRRDGRCTGQAHGEIPQITVLVSRTCGNQHTFYAEARPSVEVGNPYISVHLEQPDGAGNWLVRSVLPFSDRNIAHDDGCTPPSTQYGS